MSHYWDVPKKWVRRISPNISRIFRGCTELWFPRIFRMSLDYLLNIWDILEVRGYSPGSDIPNCKTKQKCLKMRFVGLFPQVSLEYSRGEGGPRISPEYSKIFGWMVLRTSRIFGIFGIFRRIPLPRNIRIVGHLCKGVDWKQLKCVGMDA